MRSTFVYLLAFAALPAFTSCNNNTKASDGGPIVLGDPTTIVTEADSQYLQDMVLDYKPAKVSTPAPDTIAATPAADTAKTEIPVTSNTAPTEETEAPEAPQGKGLKINLKDVIVFIPGIEAKGSGTSYQLRSGSLNGKELRISGGRIQKVSQRYQSVVVAKNSLGTLVLDNLSTTSAWKELRGTSNTFSITGLSGTLAAPKANATTIRNAVSRAVKRQRMSRKTEQKWTSALRNVHSVNKKPLSTKLRSVMWKIDGKDSKGKAFSKQIRIDLAI
jgi:hypothetical protein